MKLINNNYVEETQEEMKQRQKESAMYNIQNKYTEYSPTELMSMIISENAQTLATDNEVALRMKSYLPNFETLVQAKKPLKKGFKFTYQNELWQVVQEHTPQSIYPPSVNTASLYERIDEQYKGTEDEPIPYKVPMKLEQGKFYTDMVDIYRCTRDSGNALSYQLKELIGLYVEVV